MVAALIAACATPYAPYPSSDHKETAERFLEANPYYKALKISGTGAIKGENGWARYNSTLLINRPWKFRVAFYNPVGTAWFMAAANRKNISVIATSAGVRMVIPRRKRNVIRIGKLKLNPDDFVRLVHPGLEKKWLEKGPVGFNSNGIRLARGGAIYDFAFDSQRKIKSVRVRRRGTRPLIVRYQYGENGKIRVLMNDFLRFDLNKIEVVENFPAGTFSISGKAANQGISPIEKPLI